MSVRAAIRAYPALLRVGFVSAIAYRAEFFIWMFSTNMPLIMLAIWSSVALDGPVAGYSSQGFTAYYLCALIVRNLTSSWVVWELTMDIRQGMLSLRLLRPLHPLIVYSAENLAALPMRGLIAIPLAVVLLVTAGHGVLSHDLRLWAIFAPAMLGSWLLTFFVMSIIGTLALYVESATSLFDAWLGFSAILSGYLVPLDLFPPALARIAALLPFRFLLSFPVELMLGRVAPAEALGLLAMQWSYVGLALFGTLIIWRAGMKRFAAYGG